MISHSLTRFRTLLLVLLLTCGTSVAALALESVPEDSMVKLPADLAKLHFYLITVDVGNQVWDNFGHTALRVVDENNDIDVVFNWGLFDTSGGVIAFSFNFFKGIMDYQLGVSPSDREMNFYRQQQRTVWQDQINLTNAQKAVLYKRLAWNTQPENIVYPYQYFFDNCTTRVRDYLDEALEGRISDVTSDLTSNTYRDLVGYHYRTVPVISVALDILMNSNIDRQISGWEEMFLPLSLRARLFAVPSDLAESGVRLPLLSNPEVIVEFSPPGEQISGYYVASGFLLVPSLLLLLLLRRVPMSYFATHSRISFRVPGFSFRLLGFFGLVVSLISGVFGILMLGGWFFSSHQDLYANWNLLLFWPTDILAVLITLHWLIFAKPWPLNHNSAPFFNYYLLLKVFALAVYGFIAALNLTDQFLFRPLLFILPGLLLFTLLSWIAGFTEAKPKNMFF